jgi:hypothetical protein
MNKKRTKATPNKLRRKKGQITERKSDRKERKNKAYIHHGAGIAQWYSVGLLAG